MILSEIDQFVRFVQLKTGTSVSFGDIDLGADDLPHIKILPVSSVGIFQMSPNDNAVQFQLTVTIIANRKDERTAITILEKLLTCLPDYHRQYGHSILDGGTMRYDQNTYEITTVLTLKSIIGD